jgi:uncharacterized membrane protein
VTISDEHVGVNGVAAAALTRLVGSMPAVYVAVVIVGGWIALAAWGPLRSFDPYPFAFLLFLINVVQLLLCVMILVGQRVLGVAADVRAIQTYQHTEAIFYEVLDVHDRVDRLDRELSRGISLLESRPHPWIEQHHVQHPPQARDQAVSVNGRIAAWLTRRLGSMWAFYLAAATQLIWIGLAQTGLQTFDRYPFLFMTLLSTLAQLVLMLVIMVGQDVLGHAADRRSEQSYLDAEATIYECQRLKARLAAQERIVTSLCNYASSQVTERVAQAIHDTYARALREAYSNAAEAPARLGTWEELPEEMAEANRAQARHVGEKLAELGCVMVPDFDPSLTFEFRDEEVLRLAKMEHERWRSERIDRGFVYGPVREGRFHPDLVPWSELSSERREVDLEVVRAIPAILAGVGFQILRVAEPAPRAATWPAA